MKPITSALTWLYANVLKTRERLPLFAIGLHVAICHSVWADYTGPDLGPILHLVGLGTFCLAWELFYSIWATQRVRDTCLRNTAFVVAYSLNRFINLAVISLFASQGVPLTYVTSGYSQEVVMGMIAVIFCVNALFDLAERKWGTRYWRALLEKRTELEDKVITDLNQASSDAPLPERCARIVEKFCEDVIKINADMHDHAPPEPLSPSPSTPSFHVGIDVDLDLGRDLEAEVATLLEPLLRQIARTVVEHTERPGRPGQPGQPVQPVQPAPPVTLGLPVLSLTETLSRNVSQTLQRSLHDYIAYQNHP